MCIFAKYFTIQNIKTIIKKYHKLFCTKFSRTSILVNGLVISQLSVGEVLAFLFSPLNYLLITANQSYCAIVTQRKPH